MAESPTIATADIQLDPIFERYKTRLVNRGRKPQTISNFVRAVAPFQHWLEQREIALTDVDEETLESYFSPASFEAMGYSGGTRRLHAVQVSAALKYAHRKGYIATDPTADFEKPPEPDPDPKKKLLTSAQLRECWGNCKNWRHETLFALLAFTGLRREETRLLAWEDIDIKENVIHVREAGAKYGKRRDVPIHPFLREILLRAPGNPLDGPEPNFVAGPLGHDRKGAVLWTRDRKRHYAGGKSFEKLKDGFALGYGFHHFRKTAATSLRRNGVDPGIIDAIFGWAARNVQDRYYVAVVDADLHKAILKLYADDPLGI
jgi:integrase